MSAGFLPPDLAGLAAVVLLLGVKHGFDADHLATIDGLTRAGAVRHPRGARACGALFSLGHGAVVMSVALAASHAAAAWQVPAWLAAFGAWVSIAFLVALGLMNVASVLRTPAHEIVAPTGVRQRLLQSVFGGDAPGAGHPLWALPIGALFAISFDTVSQAALFSTAASRTGAWQGALVCALLFTTGMLITDGINGLWISRLLRRSSPTARIASRMMGLGIGAASLLIAAVGVVRQSSSTASDWLDGRELILSGAVIAMVGCAFLVALRHSTGRQQQGQQLPAQGADTSPTCQFATLEGSRTSRLAGRDGRRVHDA